MYFKDLYVRLDTVIGYVEELCIGLANYQQTIT